MTSSPFLNDIRRFMRTRGYSSPGACVGWTGSGDRIIRRVLLLTAVLFGQD